MLKTLQRMAAVIRLVRKGRGAELDRVLEAMEEGATFTGAKGHMLMSLASSGRWIEMNMQMNHHRYLSDRMLGEAWARRLDQHIKATRKDDLTEILEKL
uniref:hypothetical protein n=1 Tax=Halomonas sp. TaxID=1486246 RepID=UPI00263450E7|nr:hypothetical protein [Halomonas sp.]